MLSVTYFGLKAKVGFHCHNASLLHLQYHCKPALHKPLSSPSLSRWSSRTPAETMEMPHELPGLVDPSSSPQKQMDTLSVAKISFFLFLKDQWIGSQWLALSDERWYFLSHFPELSLWAHLIECAKAHRSLEIIFRHRVVGQNSWHADFEVKPKSTWD